MFRVLPHHTKSILLLANSIAISSNRSFASSKLRIMVHIFFVLIQSLLQDPVLKEAAAIDEGKVKKAPTRSSPNFEGNLTDEEQIIKYLAGCGIWTQGRHYEAAIELAKLCGVKGAPTPDPFAD
ncbi:hypothetical protein GLOTRDRAFT_133157 [Gloeophyllum trabeum ATCC 11539]|uniref:Uncharacterized protein n=1 Tax=Gloeophyllum trabeum (strain ATCC 11539 / FP-39264 / Madison 617) TaxID=670483 RepID=S7PTZ5_GLOTA|nr:uncharacterized protein GLOTRDRAFT_133157 [Gloeophyllum trabeum ATCC 11539]EPQ51281.1 hypothetical protein GLOTRDRAFT_133157 [Gloeophyllum trabeum ATCC 11539]